MLVIDPIPLYKDGEWRRVPAIDSQAWINAGWSLTESPVVELYTENPPENPPENSSSNQPTLAEVQVEAINLQHEPSVITVETTKRKSPNQ